MTDFFNNHDKVHSGGPEMTRPCNESHVVAYSLYRNAILPWPLKSQPQFFYTDKTRHRYKRRYTLITMSSCKVWRTLLVSCSNQNVQVATSKGMWTCPTTGGAHDAPPDPQVELPTARACGTRILQIVPSVLIPDCGAQIMVTLVKRLLLLLHHA